MARAFASEMQFAPSATKYDVVQLGGGLDLLTPTLRLKPGYVRDALNWEHSVTGGYARIPGYERFSGKAAPSSATYLTVTVTVSGTLNVGDAINGQTSGATGTVTSLTSDGVGHQIVAYTQSTGSFALAENVRTGVTVQGTVFALGGLGTNADYDVTQRSLAANVYRALIAAVPGSGPVRGGIVLAGIVYAWRDNVGATAGTIWKSSGTGWQAVALFNEVAFTTGSGAAPALGATLTQGANTATIKQVCLESGNFNTNNATGRFIVTTPAPGNFGAGASTFPGGTAALVGVQTAITIAPGGRVETDIGNFDSTPRAYGADGVNRAFEFDGTTYAPIHSSYTTDAPTHICVHKDRLWISFGATVTSGALTRPFDWTGASGAVLWRFASTVLALTRMPGAQATGAMAISMQDRTDIMYGSSNSDFQPVSFEQSAGARAYAVQRLSGQLVFFGDSGVFTAQATQAFGNFAPASLTMNIRPFTQVRRNQVTGSLVNRERSQYRVFFNDTFGLYLTMVNGRLLGSMPVQFPNKVACCWAGTSPDGTEVSYFGSDNGMVYALDQGTSHDGAAIASYFTLVFNAEGNSRIVKRYRGAAFEVQGDTYCTFSVTSEVGYGATDRTQGSSPQTLPVVLSSVYWDSFVWDEFVWDGRQLAPSQCRLSGRGVNVALRIDSTSDKFAAFTINSAIVHYSPLKALKH